jgi:hypothetical protein
MAALAVRTGQGQFIQEGLAALAIALPLADWMDIAPNFGLLYHSAEKIGLDPVTSFEAAMVRADSEFQRLAGGFLTLEKERRSLELMGYVESMDQDGFRYRRTW